METYEKSSHAYHATMPTDGLTKLNETMKEIGVFGFGHTKHQQYALGEKIQTLLLEKGFKMVAPEGFRAPGVVVCYTNDPEIHNGKKFAQLGYK